MLLEPSPSLDSTSSCAAIKRKCSSSGSSEHPSKKRRRISKTDEDSNMEALLEASCKGEIGLGRKSRSRRPPPEFLKGLDVTLLFLFVFAFYPIYICLSFHSFKKKTLRRLPRQFGNTMFLSVSPRPSAWAKH